VDDPLRRTTLHFAAEARDHHEVARLLAGGVPVDSRDYRKNTPLHFAAGMGSAEVVTLLLEAGADPAARNTFGETPLHRLAAGGGSASAAARLDVVDRLLGAGCPIDALDSTDRTALWYAAATGTSESPPEVLSIRFLVLKGLIERGADPTITAKGTQGRPVDASKGLHQSKEYRRVWPEAVTLLEAAGDRSSD
jgi:ankyrin repeat protein